MITSEDILNLNFYKKEKFTGSYQGMRYLIQKDKIDAPSDSKDAAATSMDIFRVTIWPGPYNFASTAEEKKNCQTFPFTEEGKKQVVDWLNEQWHTRKDEWPLR